MRASIFVGTSLDGFIARENGDIDWLPAGGDEHGYNDFYASVDTVVIGRKSFEAVLKFGAWLYGRKRVVVLSSHPERLTAPPGANAEFTCGEPREIVARLEERGAKHLYVDGGITIQRFLEAGLIQRLIITRIPVLIGTGTPLFGPLPRDVQLRHIATRAHESGLVTSEYEVLEQRTPLQATHGRGKRRTAAKRRGGR